MFWVMKIVLWNLIINWINEQFDK